MNDFLGDNSAAGNAPGRPSQRPGAGNLAGIGDGNRPGNQPGVRPGVGDANRPGVGNNNRPGNLPGVGNNNQPGVRPGIGENNRPGVANNNRPVVGNNTGAKAVAGNNVNRGGDTNINVGNVNVGNSVNYADNRQAWVNNQHNNGNIVRANSGNRYWGAYNNPGFRAGVAVGGFPYYRGAGWGAPGFGWTAATWAGVGLFMGAALTNNQPVYYAYGSGGNVYYENNTVYVDGQPAGTSEEYLQQAQALVAAAPAADDSQEWMPLGVFAFTREDVADSQAMLELAVNKAGVIAGTYHNEATGATRPVKGTADPQSQRAAIGFADGKNPDVVLETGIYNLTQDESPALLHVGADQTQPVMLVRLQMPEQQ